MKQILITALAAGFLICMCLCINSGRISEIEEKMRNEENID